MNRCYWCNHFRRWEDLGWVYLPEPGSPALEPLTIAQCKSGTGCEKTAPYPRRSAEDVQPTASAEISV